ncbi:MAG: YkgJ family cysteine cluster protein [Pirellulales bacterium]
MTLDEHQLDEVGDHNEDECEVCIERNCMVKCSCRCGDCCSGRLLIEVSLRDAEREPRIAKEEGPVYEGLSGDRQLIGYILNGKDAACIFLDRRTKLCTIYETRPLVCRVYNCDTDYLPV